MAAITASPSTPASRTAAPPAAPTPPTGSWRHPKMDEIAQRQKAATFDSHNLRDVTISIFVLVASVLLPGMLPSSLIPTLSPPYKTIAVHYPKLALQIFCFFKIFVALSPLWRPKDDMSDIPLTPSQRKLLGLGPASTPATPGSSYITPPRYARSTPRSSSTRAAVFGSSPLDRSTSGSPISGSPLAGRGIQGSPYGMSGYGTPPPNGSPLVRKAVEGRRWSSGASGLRESISRSELLGLSESTSTVPGSPSPSGQRNASVGLNSKWLYQRGKGRPSGGSLYS